MGCTKSKLDNKVCLKDEMMQMHINFIKNNGLAAYFQVIGMEDESNHNSFEDNNSNLNLGLINIESKNENDIEIHNSGLSVCEYVEIAVVIIIALGAIRIIYRFFKQRRAKAVLKKKNSLKEMMKSVTVPNTGIFVKTVNQQLPMKEMSQTPQEENMERQIVPVIPQNTNKPVPVNVSRMPIFPTSYYN